MVNLKDDVKDINNNSNFELKNDGNQEINENDVKFQIVENNKQNTYNMYIHIL